MALLQFYNRFLLLFLICSVLTVQPFGLLAADDLPADEGDGNSIYGLVWTDLNGNGVYEGQEPFAVGQTVFVTPDIESDFAQILVLSTDEQGEFSATSLAAGRYRVWAATQSEDTATLVNVTGDRAVMTVQLPLVGFTLYMPQITR